MTVYLALFPSERSYFIVEEYILHVFIFIFDLNSFNPLRSFPFRLKTTLENILYIRQSFLH